MATVESNVDHVVASLEGQLKLWGVKLDQLVAKARVSSEEAKLDSHEHLDELKAKLEAAQRKLHDARAARGEKWEAFKHDLELSWKDLEGAFKKLVH